MGTINIHAEREPIISYLSDTGCRGGNYGQNLKIPFCNMVVNKGKLWSKFENHFLKNGFPFPCFFWPQVALGWLLGCQGFRGKLVALLLFENAFRNRIEEAVANCKPPPVDIL